MYPINAEVAARVKAVQLLELEARERSLTDTLAGRAPAFGVDGGDSKGVAAAEGGAAPGARAGLAAAVQAGKSGASPGAGAVVVPGQRGLTQNYK